MTTPQPRLLDLFGGAQGAAFGYSLAGFDVTTVDREYHKSAPLRQMIADAVEVARDRQFLAGFDAVTASPPCQSHTRLKHLREHQGRQLREHGGDLIEPIRAALRAWGGPYIIENVPDAPLLDPVTLCGSSFGLKVRRHRLFESNVYLTGLPCDHRRQGRPLGVYGSLNDRIPSGGHTATDLQAARAAMGIPWMRWADLTEAIPPAYTAHLGRQLMTYLGQPLRPVCEQCGSAMSTPAREQGGGRTKRYCSGACRVAAHRQRRPTWADQ